MILVTGGLGYLGGRICEELVNSGEQVRIGTSRKNVKVPEALSKCDIVDIDLLEPNLLKTACDGVDAIIHLAALNAIECNLDPKQALLINGFGTQNLLMAAIQSKVKRFLYFSTIHVYGNKNKSPISESTIPKPSHHYAITHKLAEDYVLNANDSISVSVFRLSNVIGSPMSKETNCWMLVAHDLCQQVIINGSMELNSNKKVTRDFISLNNLSKITCMSIKNNNFKKIKDNIINIVSGEAISLENLVQIIAIEFENIFHFKPKIKYNNSKVRKIETIVFSNQKAKSLGFDLKTDLHHEINTLLLNCEKWYGS